ncbi:MAG: OmpA family protein [Pseudomonadota bacterium]
MTLDVPDRVFFAANDVALTPESRKTIGYWASVLLEHPGSVTIEGHADEPPDDEVALELSARRATVVRQALIELGVPAASLKMRAYGNARPIIITDGHLTVSENRRAVLTHLPPS